jgi:colanic acid biosynthesis glycosyl transferase WcaI
MFPRRSAVDAKLDEARARVPRIVFVEQFYFPEGWGGAELPRDVTTHLAQQGCDVEVICGTDLYAPLDGDPGLDPALGGVRIRRVPRLIRGEIHRLKLLRQSWFYAGLVARLLYGRAADVYVSQTNPPLAVPIVALAAWLRRRPFLVIAMDIYPDVIVAHGALAPDSPITRILDVIFQRAYRSARRVVSLGPVMTRRLIGKGVRQACIREVSNWATGPTGVVHGESNRLRSEWRLGKDFVLLYSGNLGIGHEFETLLQGFAAARSEAADLRLVIVGRGSRLVETRRRVAELNLGEAVHFADLVPAARLPESLGVADVAVATLRAGFEGLIVPSKVLGYLARAIPVVYVGPISDIDHLIEQYGCGYSVRNGDVEGVRKAILDAHADRERLLARGRAGQAGYDAYLRRDLGLVRYASVIAECLPPECRVP